MTAYIVRRLLLIIPTMLLLSAIVFVAIRLVPGDVIDQMVSEHVFASQVEMDKTAAAIRARLGLDVPVYVQYIRWLGNIVLHGDLGTSLWKGTPVTEEIMSRLPVSIELGILAIIVGMLISLPIGIYSAIRQDTWGDYLGRSLAILFIAVPYFWVGIMVMVFPSIWWHWTPQLDYVPFWQNPLPNLIQFIIPAIILSMLLSGIVMRMARTMMLEVLRQDYIRTAWAKGLHERTVILRHAMRNALIPVVTILGLQLPVLISGSVVIEEIFALPGIGRLVLESISSRDYTVVTGINVFMATIVLLLNLVVDLTYGLLDPRVHYQ